MGGLHADSPHALQEEGELESTPGQLGSDGGLRLQATDARQEPHQLLVGDPAPHQFGFKDLARLLVPMIFPTHVRNASRAEDTTRDYVVYAPQYLSYMIGSHMRLQFVPRPTVCPEGRAFGEDEEMKSNEAGPNQATAAEVACRAKLMAYVKDGGVLIQLPKAGAVRARKVVSRSGVRHTAKYPSLKMGRMMQAESVHELHAFQLLDADPSIEAFYEQPFTIYYSIAGAVHRHVPDVLVRIKGVQIPQIWEIKETKELNDPLLQDRTRNLERNMPSMGYTYALVLAENLERGHLLANAQRLLRLGKASVSAVTRERVRRMVGETGPLTWDAVRRGQLGARGLNILSRLALEGYLTFDRQTPIIPTTRFYLDEKSSREL